MKGRRQLPVTGSQTTPLRADVAACLGQGGELSDPDEEIPLAPPIGEADVEPVTARPKWSE